LLKGRQCKGKHNPSSEKAALWKHCREGGVSTAEPSSNGGTRSARVSQSFFPEDRVVEGQWKLGYG